MLYNQDCVRGMQEMAENSAALVLADPPYGIDYQSCWAGDKTKRKPKIANDKGPFVWFLQEAYRVTKPGGCILCFCRWDVQMSFHLAMKWAGFRVKSSIVWDKCAHGMGDLKGAFAPRHELILFGAKGRFIFPGKRARDVITMPRVSPEKMTHPNEKPVELLRALVEYTTRPGDLVVDPFAGSGAAGEATLEAGRRYIGFELDEVHFQNGEKRILAVQRRKEAQ